MISLKALWSVSDSVILFLQAWNLTSWLVVPLSVMSNWEKQIEDHCVPGMLSSCVYYGASRSKTPQELMEYDVVITTYQVRIHLNPSTTGVSYLQPTFRLSPANMQSQVVWKMRQGDIARRRRKLRRDYSTCNGRYGQSSTSISKLSGFCLSRELSLTRAIISVILRRRWQRQFVLLALSADGYSLEPQLWVIMFSTP